VIWRRVTLALVGLCLTLPAWMYLRERVGYSPQQAERAQAELDADRILTLLKPSRACRGRCSIELKGTVAPHLWRVRFQAPAWQRCFVLNVNIFRYEPQNGLSGLRLSGCG
jgi:hypothetical protein